MVNILDIAELIAKNNKVIDDFLFFLTQYPSTIPTMLQVIAEYIAIIGL